ncbi:RNA polymerase sigma factor FliA [Sporomusa acidovorans DSM 3132]|uniref:RNA polymerase sigma factor FliA n=1 Tax=Sporomusa acidovorans (strain ATCC 49682 / DSM 3132 / Mol) TaxID=1123286 RepID=A0ABZ3J896_SPOA4|nr:RNA polymerase sigma factor FliA [Sporomusa acidovorans DSM 3132]SDD78024.1 RNA polymerase sigma factor, sigma-70 family [Sporomusa acidovorans]
MEQLVNKAQGRQDGEDAFAEICRRFTGLVKKYANQPHVAAVREEALAEGWLAVAEAVQSYDQHTGVRFAGFVESRVKYAVWNLFKRERRRWQQELPVSGGGSGDEERENTSWLETLADDQNVEELVENSFTVKAVQQAIGTLPAKQRVAVVRTLLEDARLSDVAAELGISSQAVCNLRQRGLARIKKELR